MSLSYAHIVLCIVIRTRVLRNAFLATQCPLHCLGLTLPITFYCYLFVSLLLRPFLYCRGILLAKVVEALEYARDICRSYRSISISFHILLQLDSKRVTSADRLAHVALTALPM